MKNTVLPPNYRPDETESYMNDLQLSYFKNKLEDWRRDLMKGSVETLSHLQQESLNQPDITDRATIETDRALELRARDRERKLIDKINQAISRIDDGTYGFCDDTGEPIGLKRLEARPIATLSVEAQEKHERLERTHK